MSPQPLSGPGDTDVDQDDTYQGPDPVTLGDRECKGDKKGEGRTLGASPGRKIFVKGGEKGRGSES